MDFLGIMGFFFGFGDFFFPTSPRPYLWNVAMGNWQLEDVKSFFDFPTILLKAKDSYLSSWSIDQYHGKPTKRTRWLTEENCGNPLVHHVESTKKDRFKGWVFNKKGRYKPHSKSHPSTRPDSKAMFQHNGPDRAQVDRSWSRSFCANFPKCSSPSYYKAWHGGSFTSSTHLGQWWVPRPLTNLTLCHMHVCVSQQPFLVTLNKNTEIHEIW